MKSDVFNVELERITDDKIRESTKYILNNLPDYFYEVPASSSGKYHPVFSLGKGGLVRHVKVAERIAEEYFKDEVFCPFDDHKKDLIRMAILLHDGFKSGLEYSMHTVVEHPLLMSKYILENIDKLSISVDDVKDVARMISTHMGPWVNDRKGNKVLPKPEKEDELFVHNCDYIASRNFLNVSFLNNAIVDSVERDKVKKYERDKMPKL